MTEDKLSYKECLVRNSKKVFKIHVIVIVGLLTLIGLCYGIWYARDTISGFLALARDNAHIVLAAFGNLAVTALAAVGGTLGMVPWPIYLVFGVTVVPYMGVAIYCYLIRLPSKNLDFVTAGVGLISFLLWLIGWTLTSGQIPNDNNAGLFVGTFAAFIMTIAMIILFVFQSSRREPRQLV
jgi:hypothetical protein